MYKIFIRPILFLFNPETAHNITFFLLKLFRFIPFARIILKKTYQVESKSLSKEVFGINFKNPVGLAGGLDKNGEFYNDLSNFGFGFVEIGSLTPLPQSGNPKPRLFRIVKDKSIINRMGINNKGVKYAVERLKENKPNLIVAANISKNTTSINEDATRDYESAFALMYDFVDMFVINVSCPNVVGLSALQDITFLSDIIDRLLNLRMYFDEYRPILIKISPDIQSEQLDDILDYAMRSGVDGIVAGNTTRSREGLTLEQSRIDSIGNGGMSGALIFEKNKALVSYIHKKTEGNLPIIGVGGIMSGAQAKEMLDAGASLIEIYTGFIFEGPSLVKKILKTIKGTSKN